MKLYRPVGLKEFDLIQASGFSAFPPRLPGQPIFYPVLNIEYARQIAKEWNTKDAASGYKGYVLCFKVNDAFISKYPVQRVGAGAHREFWIPSEELDEFNANIVGPIEVLEEY
jgi:hypothetical protein